jgi:hypothetical protein
MSFWKRLFRLVENKIDDRIGSWGESYWLWENDCCYKGGETIKIHAPSDAIRSLMDELEMKNPRLLLKIKRVYVRYVRSEFRGSGWVGGYIEGDKEFLERLIVESYYTRGDGWSLGTGRLIINGKLLEKLRWTQDIDDYLKTEAKP